MGFCLNQNYQNATQYCYECLQTNHSKHFMIVLDSLKQSNFSMNSCKCTINKGNNFKKSRNNFKNILNRFQRKWIRMLKYWKKQLNNQNKKTI
ncbi:unnamed protein product [Paramecium octaurelia]|uniref:Uncharacterized protein n=1 Tax=Paramecium octaurelia TaxID=43137 RepID=A0A8S1UWN0_PAROT|nr:unnamed protein product [Paramecium octaurelia]